MKKCMTMAAALVAVAAMAQEFGGQAAQPVAEPTAAPAAPAAEAAPAEAAPAAEATPAASQVKPVGQGPGVEAILQAQDSEPEPGPKADEMLKEWLGTKEGFTTGYDEEHNRIIVIEYVEFPVKNPKVSSAFIELRTEKMSELLLKSKSKVIETIMSKMSAARVLEVPGNPIAKQLETEQQEVNRALRLAQENMADLGVAAEEALKNRDQMSTNEIFAVISSWFTRAERENLAEKWTEEKKQTYQEAREAFVEAEKTYRALLQQAETLKGQLTKEMKTSISRFSKMPIYGCTVLQQAETFYRRDGQYVCRLAVAFAWSAEMQRAAGEILQGRSVKFAPGKKPIKKWLAEKQKKGALAQWCGPRQYIDDKGNMWFLGIACTPVLSADFNDEQRGIADLAAGAEVIFSLYADAASQRTAEKLMRETMGSNGEKETKVYKAYQESQSESFKDIQISGNSELFAGEVRHKASGLDLNVVVYGVSSGSVKSLADIQKQAVALGIDINTVQEFERGRQAQLNRDYEASKKNAAAYAAGAATARQEVNNERAAAKARREQRKQQAAAAAAAKPAKPAAKPAPRKDDAGTLRLGSTFIIDEDVE